MKPKISKIMRLPMLCGLLAAWIVVGGITVACMATIMECGAWRALLAVSGVLLLALWPVMRRAAWVYSNVRRLHTAEYYYELGNGVEAEKAVKGYEQKVQTAVAAWLKRKLFASSFGAVPVSFFVLVGSGAGYLAAFFYAFATAVLVCVASFAGMSVMLYVARRLCYDKYGVIKR